jgi:ankyrin repeat protein
VTRSVELNVELNSHSQDGSVPLHHAAEEHHLKVVRVLLDAGADATATNNVRAPWVCFRVHHGVILNVALHVVLML